MAFKRPSGKRRFKILLFGDPGIGKTTTAVRSPKPAFIDMEDGTGHYEHLGDFVTENTTDPDEAMAIIDRITKNPKIELEGGEIFNAKTFVLDPIHIWELALAQKLIDQRVKETRDTNYTLQLEDYQIIKAKKKKLMLKLMSVDFNVMVCARTKPIYAPGAIMKKIGIGPDCDDMWLGFFDTIIYLYKDPGTKKRMGVIYQKDRTGKFPSDQHGNFVPFEFTYDIMAEFLKGMDFEADVDTTRMSIKDIDAVIVKNFETEFRGESVRTAGVTGEQLEVIAQFFENPKTKEKVKEILSTIADVKEPYDLTGDMALQVIELMNKK